MALGTPLPPDHPRSLEEHLAELRRRVLWCLAGWVGASIVCYAKGSWILGILAWPLQKVWSRADLPLQFIYTHLAEGFLVSLRLALWGGFALSLPLWLVHVWRFVGPGLYPEERRVWGGILLMSPVLFALGSAFAYGVIIPNAWLFLSSFQASQGPLSLALYPRLSEYIDFMTQVLLAFGICFQFPLVLLGLFWMGWLTVDHLVRFRRWSIVLIFFVAAVVTPPDVLSQVALALPLMGLYEVTILLCRWLAKFR